MKIKYVLWFLSLASLVLLNSCAKKPAPQIPETPLPKELNSVISAYTTGMVSRESAVRVIFVQNVVEAGDVGKVVESPVFSFKPDINGTAVWADIKTVEFRPNKHLLSDQLYEVKIHIDKILPAPLPSKSFDFKFATVKQSFDVQTEGLQFVSPKQAVWQRLKGTVSTADVEDGINVENMMSAIQKGKKLKVTWMHSENRREHVFTVDSIRRGEDTTSVQIKCDGKSIGVDNVHEENVAVPALSDFKVTEVNPVIQGEKHILIRFSDPLKSRQNLSGLIRVGNMRNLKFIIDGNTVRVHNPRGWKGQKSVRIEKQIKNINGYGLKKFSDWNVEFREIKPAVRFVGKGSIIPGTMNTTIPIEAVNLRAVRVNIIQIYANNITQFLQVNNIQGDQQIPRVGRSIWQKTVALNPSHIQRSKWTRYNLDIGPLLTKATRGIFQIQLSFKRQHSLYPCADDPEQIGKEQEFQDWDEESESSYWDTWESYQNYSWSEYYENRDNPCHPAYYREGTYYGRKTKQTRNFLIS
jgi:hypothetical protein